MVRYYVAFRKGQFWVLYSSIYIYRDLFFFIDEPNVANYADDNSVYAAAANNELVIKQLESESKILR